MLNTLTSLFVRQPPAFFIYFGFPVPSRALFPQGTRQYKERVLTTRRFQNPKCHWYKFIKWFSSVHVATFSCHGPQFIDVNLVAFPDSDSVYFDAFIFKRLGCDIQFRERFLIFSLFAIRKEDQDLWKNSQIWVFFPSDSHERTSYLVGGGGGKFLPDQHLAQEPSLSHKNTHKN